MTDEAPNHQYTSRDLLRAIKAYIDIALKSACLHKEHEPFLLSHPLREAQIAKEVKDQLLPKYRRDVPVSVRRNLDINCSALERRCNYWISCSDSIYRKRWGLEE